MKQILIANQRAAILVDSSNIFMAALEMGVRVDYSKVLEKFNGRQILRSIIYHVEIDPKREKHFLKKIMSMGFEVKTKQIKTYPNGKTKADMDVDITIDAVCLADKVDVICLLSGDGDYVPLVNYLKSRGLKVEAMAFEQSTSNDLKRAVDEFIAITEDLFLEPEPIPCKKVA